MFLFNLNSSLLDLQNCYEICSSTSTESKTFTVDISNYRLLVLELYFYSTVVAQIILPRNRYSNFRCVSGYVDSAENLAIGSLQFTNPTTVNCSVSKQVYNHVKIVLSGIK